MSSYTSSLKLILPVTGEFTGTWGTAAINDQITSLVDVAVAGYTTVAWTTPGTDQTLTNGNGSAANEARSMYLNITGAPGSALNVIAPTASKLYYIKNSTSGGFAVTLKTSAGTGVSVPNGKAMVLVCDATNIVDAITAFSSVSIASTLDVTGVSTLTDGAVIQGLTVGQGAGSQVTTTAVGFEALGVNTSYDNTATGYRALYLNTGGNGNTAIGSEALRDTVGSSNNTAVGVSALLNNTGSSNVGLGGSALVNCSTGAGNTGINPINAAGTYVPVFNVTTEDNRFCMGSTSVTNAYIQVAWTVVSDARDKTNFGVVPHGLAFINKLNPVSFQYKESRDVDVPHGPVRYGFKAQDVLALEGASPVVVDAEDSEKLRFNESSLVPILVKAIQELSAKFDAYVAAHP